MKTSMCSKLLALALVFVMAFGMLGNTFVTVNAAAPANYTDITEGQSKTVSISYSGGAVYFRFVPRYTGTYVFQSSDSNDPVGYLLDSSGNTLTSNDDGGPGNRDFLISHSCTAGTVYYLKATMYNSGTGSYTVTVTGTEPAPGVQAGGVLDTQDGTYTYQLFNSGATGAGNGSTARNLAVTSLTNNGYDIYARMNSGGDSPTAYLGLAFRVNDEVIEQATLQIAAYDVDEGDGERDYIYLVDETAGTETQLSGYLSGMNDQMNTTTMRIDPSLFTEGHVYRIKVVVTSTRSGPTWWVHVRSVGITLTTGQVTVPDEILDHSFTADISSSGQVNTSLYLETNQEVTYSLEYAATCNHNQYGSSLNQTITANPSGVTKTVSFRLESGAPEGNYQVDVILKDAAGNVKGTYTVTTSGPNNSTVNYDANGGSNNLPLDYNVYLTGDVVEVLFNYLPSKYGYTFQGWARNANATAPEFAQGGTRFFTIGNNDVTLYAVWEAEHTHSYTETVVPPTCTTAGYTEHTCSCGDSYRDSETPATGHNYGDWIVDTEATCTTPGSKHAVCTGFGCDERQEAYIPATGHSYTSEVTREATCTEPGVITHTCSNCDDVYLTYIYSEHVYEISAHQDAACTADGYTDYTCTRCGDTRREEIPGSHDYVAVITKVATASEDGEITYTCSICGDSYVEIIPARPDAKVLLVQDRYPWNENSNTALLNQMVNNGYITGWDITTTTNFDSVQLASYGVILIANDQSTATYDKLGNLQSTLEQFATAGGVVIYGACDQGWAGGSIRYTLPEGVTTGNFYSHYNYIADADHPVVTGNYTDGKVLTNSLLYGNYCSHTAFFDLPADANIILQDGHGDPTLVEYAVGDGHIILSGLTWEFYYFRNHYDGRTNTTYTRNVYDDLILYALNLSDPCDHAYDAGVVINPTCTEQGYTLHTCEFCCVTMKDTFVPAAGHVRNTWHVVQEPTAAQPGLRVISCAICGETLEEEILPIVDAPVVSVVAATDPVVLGQTFEVYIAVRNCVPVKSAAFVLDYNSDIFELVSVEWLMDATIQVITPEIASAWAELTDVNGNLLKLVFKANALTEGSVITADAYVQDNGVVNLSVVGDTVTVVECSHETFTTSSFDDTYHLNTCVMCGYNTVSVHSYDHSCDTTCNGCTYTREITHMEGNMVYDDVSHWQVCAVCGEILNVEAHSYDNSCDTDCNVCGADREITHTPCANWEHSATEHWLNCSVCGETIERHTHEYDDLSDCICNICGYCRVMRGDVDGDNDVDSDDAIYLLLHTYFPEAYPLNQDGNMNGIGIVDSDDVIYLLLYTYFPEQYPLYYPEGY